MIRASRRALPYGLFFLSAVAVVLPFSIAENAWVEWANPYWFLVSQSSHLQVAHLPTRFIDSAPSGLFYPQYVFYAGVPTYLLSTAALVLGTWTTFVFSWMLAYWMAATGVWLAIGPLRLSTGIRFALSSGAALSPYLVTLLYGRGAWAEALAVGFGWLSVGLTVQVASAPMAPLRRMALGLLLALSTAMLGLTHNISLLLFVLFGVPTAIGLVAASVNLRLAWRNLAFAGTLLVLGVLGAAWNWLPGLAYRKVLLISQWFLPPATEAFNSMRVVFSPTLYFPPEQREVTAKIYGRASSELLYNQTVTLIVATTLVAFLVSAAWRGLSRTQSLPLILLLTIACVITILMVNTALWAQLPSLLQSVQFPYRLNSWLTLVLIAICATALRNVKGPTIILPAFGAALLAAMGCWQAYVSLPSTAPGIPIAEKETLLPSRPPPMFREGTAAPVQFRMLYMAKVDRTPRAVHLNAMQTVWSLKPGTYSTNVNCTPFIRWREGVVVRGQDSDGFCVIEISRHFQSGDQLLSGTLSRAEAAAAAVTLTALLSVLSIAFVETARQRRVSKAGHRWARAQSHSVGR